LAGELQTAKQLHVREVIHNPSTPKNSEESDKRSWGSIKNKKQYFGKQVTIWYNGQNLFNKRENLLKCQKEHINRAKEKEPENTVLEKETVQKTARRFLLDED